MTGTQHILKREEGKLCSDSQHELWNYIYLGMALAKYLYDIRQAICLFQYPISSSLILI